MRIEQIARIAYEASRVYAEEARLPSMPPWWNVSTEVKNDTIATVQAFTATGRIAVVSEKEHVFAAVMQVLLPRAVDHLYAAVAGEDRTASSLVRAGLSGAIPSGRAASNLGEAVEGVSGAILNPVGTAEEPPVPNFLSDDEVRELKLRHGIDPDKPFDPSAPIPVLGRAPADAETTTHEANLQQLGTGVATTTAEQEKTDGEKHEGDAKDVAEGERAQADGDGRQAAGEAGTGSDVEKSVEAAKPTSHHKKKK